MDDLQFLVKPFAELSSEQLYALLKLRSEVFVVEQDCIYLDLDDRDQQAWHVLGLQDDSLVCYARLLPPGSRFPEPSIGRVVSAASVRRFGYGRPSLPVSGNGQGRKSASPHSSIWRPFIRVWDS